MATRLQNVTVQSTPHSQPATQQPYKGFIITTPPGMEGETQVSYCLPYSSALSPLPIRMATSWLPHPHPRGKCGRAVSATHSFLGPFCCQGLYPSFAVAVWQSRSQVLSSFPLCAVSLFMLLAVSCMALTLHLSSK